MLPAHFTHGLVYDQSIFCRTYVRKYAYSWYPVELAFSALNFMAGKSGWVLVAKVS